MATISYKLCINIALIVVIIMIIIVVVVVSHNTDISHSSLSMENNNQRCQILYKNIINFNSQI